MAHCDRCGKRLGFFSSDKHVMPSEDGRGWVTVCGNCRSCSKVLGGTETVRTEAATKDRMGFEQLIQKLVSRDDATFGDGLTEVLAIPESDPLRVHILSEAIRHRSGKSNVRFYEPNVGGLTVRTGEELSEAHDELIELAQKGMLLADPKRSGSLISAFMVSHPFEDVVDLCDEIGNVTGLDQFQAFQLLYNQVRTTVKLRTSRGEKTWTQQMTERFEDGED